MKRLPVRGLVLIVIALAGVWAAVRLDLGPAGLVPGRGGLAISREFFAAALRPAVRDEAGYGVFLPGLALEAAGKTVVFAAAAMSLACVLGLALGFFASTAWWKGERRRGWLRRWAAPVLYAGTRLLIVGLRSVHELLWALLFLCAFGLSNAAAVLAIALPYGGTLAKVFSEILDESPLDTMDALRDAGAGPLQAFAFGLFPRALPDMAAYAFYRFECALRSSAVLGFFGFPTLGYYIALSFENLYYREVWTYLYVLLALVALVDAWSGALRRRVVAA